MGCWCFPNQIVETPCHHRFHYKCINLWVETSMNRECPNCRQIVNTLYNSCGQNIGLRQNRPQWFKVVVEKFNNCLMAAALMVCGTFCCGMISLALFFVNFVLLLFLDFAGFWTSGGTYLCSIGYIMLAISCFVEFLVPNLPEQCNIHCFNIYMFYFLFSLIFIVLGNIITWIEFFLKQNEVPGEHFIMNYN